MTDENRKQMEKDMEYLLSEEYGPSAHLIYYRPHFSMNTGAKITVCVSINAKLLCIHRKTDNNRVILDALREVAHTPYHITDRVALEV
jgi:hypothetical protein